MASAADILGDVSGVGLLAKLLGHLFSGGSSSSPVTVSNSVDSSDTSGSSSTRKALLPQQSSLLQPYSDLATRLLKDPSSSLRPLRTAAVAQVNKNYAGAPQTIADKLLAYGGSSSGKFGKAVASSELARRGEISDVDASIIPLALDQQNIGATLTEKLLGMDFGSDTSSSSSTGKTGSQVSGQIDDDGSALLKMLADSIRATATKQAAALPPPSPASNLVTMPSTSTDALVRRHLGDDAADGLVHSEDLYAAAAKKHAPPKSRDDHGNGGRPNPNKERDKRPPRKKLGLSGDEEAAAYSNTALGPDRAASQAEEALADRFGLKGAVRDRALAEIRRRKAAASGDR